MTGPRPLRTIHATAVHWPRANAGALLLGPSGAGKSDLALRLLDRGWLLVADDRVVIAAGAASCPPAIAGLLEVRGLGLVRVPHVRTSRLALAVTLGEPDRLPEPATWTHPAQGPDDESLTLPHIHLAPWPASAPLVLELAMARVARSPDG